MFRKNKIIYSIIITVITLLCLSIYNTIISRKNIDFFADNGITCLSVKKVSDVDHFLALDIKTKIGHSALNPYTVIYNIEKDNIFLYIKYILINDYFLSQYKGGVVLSNLESINYNIFYLNEDGTSKEICKILVQ